MVRNEEYRRQKSIAHISLAAVGILFDEHSSSTLPSFAKHGLELPVAREFRVVEASFVLNVSSYFISILNQVIPRQV